MSGGAFDFKALGDDARVVAGGSFGMMRVGGTAAVTFRTPARISARGAAALVELVEAGAVSESRGPHGEMVYRPLVDCGPMFRWLGRNLAKADWSIVDPATHPLDRISFELDGVALPPMPLCPQVT